MHFQLEKVIPWGRSFEEYVKMFSLTADDLNLRILGCGDGPAAFNSGLTNRGGRVISIDPIYGFTSTQIRGRIAETYETVMDQMQKIQDDYIWSTIASVEELGRMRMAAMEAFLADFDTGKEAGRYIQGELPGLPFEHASFDLALCSHFLFLYSEQFSPDFHLEALQEMLRVATEVRVFPLLTLEGHISPHLDFVRERLSANGFRSSIKPVDYEFQRGGNEMLVIDSV
jgi:hypothetical protein